MKIIINKKETIIDDIDLMNDLIKKYPYNAKETVEGVLDLN